MDSLGDFLFENGYHRIKLKKNPTNHFEIVVRVNKVKGNFILDTGASNSCMGFDGQETFHLTAEASSHKASGAGPTQIETMIAKKNVLRIGKCRHEKIDLVLIDLSHINTALQSQNANLIHGIIGADILHNWKAIIDYDKKYLYLKDK